MSKKEKITLMKFLYVFILLFSSNLMGQTCQDYFKEYLYPPTQGLAKTFESSIKTISKYINYLESASTKSPPQTEVSEVFKKSLLPVFYFYDEFHDPSFTNGPINSAKNRLNSILRNNRISDINSVKNQDTPLQKREYIEILSRLKEDLLFVERMFFKE